jgi:23S rRNA (pseudouridine1915-N3)-methyltransferase
MKRSAKASIAEIVTTETNKLLATVPKDNLIVALDEHGKEWRTYELATQLATWHQEQQDISLLIGGPDGLAKNMLREMKIVWSLSRLTLPHQLVKIIVIEQLYRAWSIINNHPYHRS